MTATCSPAGLKSKIRAGTPLIGCYVTFPSPEVVELFARAGMDYVVMDMQHSSPDWQTFAHMLRAADAGGISAVVRLHSHEPSLILKVLEMGAEGISLPGVKNASDIRAAADAIYYAPLGHRGACGHTRIGGYNSTPLRFPRTRQAPERKSMSLGHRRGCRGDQVYRANCRCSPGSGRDWRRTRRSVGCYGVAGSDRSSASCRCH